MEKKKFEIRKGMQLRKIGDRYMIVDACTENVNMSNVYSLNHTAAWMWKSLEEAPLTVDELAEKLCLAYEVDKDTAFHDVEKQLADWKTFGLVEQVCHL